MIVVEGPDGAGKTELTRFIAEEFGLEYRRAPTLSSITGPDDEVAEWWVQQMAHDDGDGVYDRSFLVSEFVYALATDRPPIKDAQWMRHRLSMFWTVCDLLIFCLPPFDVQLENLNAVGRGRLIGVDEGRLRRISWAYEYLLELFKASMYERCTVWDYTSMNHDHIREACAETLGLTI
jgi:hypothetical protein